MPLLFTPIHISILVVHGKLAIDELLYFSAVPRLWLVPEIGKKFGKIW